MIVGVLIYLDLCKILTVTIYNLFRLQSRCSMLVLKELDLNCRGKGRGFRKSHTLFKMFRKFYFFFQGSVKIILMETESALKF